MKVWFIGGREHLASQRHGREEVFEAIERIKAKHLTALHSVKDLTALYEMYGAGNEFGDEEKHEDYVQREEAGLGNIAFIASSDTREIEQHFAMSPFLDKNV